MEKTLFAGLLIVFAVSAQASPKDWFKTCFSALAPKNPIAELNESLGAAVAKAQASEAYTFKFQLEFHELPKEYHISTRRLARNLGSKAAIGYVSAMGTLEKFTYPYVLNALKTTPSYFSLNKENWPALVTAIDVDGGKIEDRVLGLYAAPEDMVVIIHTFDDYLWNDIQTYHAGKDTIIRELESWSKLYSPDGKVRFRFKEASAHPGTQGPLGWMKREYLVLSAEGTETAQEKAEALIFALDKAAVLIKSHTLAGHKDFKHGYLTVVERQKREAEAAERKPVYGPRAFY